MSDTIVSFSALPNFSLISVRRSLNTAASAWQIFLVSVIPDPHSLHFLLYRTVLSWFHCMYCTTPLPRHSRRCLQKPSLSKALLRVHVSAKANVHYPRSCIVQDALFSVSEKLGSVCVSFETESQYTFLYRHSTDFGTWFPTLSYNPLSRQSTVRTHVTLPSEPRYFSAVSMNRLYVNVQTTALPVNGVADRRFRHERSHSYILFCWCWFPLALCTVCRSCNTRHRIPEYLLPLFFADCHRPFRDMLKAWCPFRHNVKNPPFTFGPPFYRDASRIVIPMTTSVHSSFTRRLTNSTPTYSAVRWDSWYLTRIQVQSYTWI